ncbi:triose-phosphate isomerase [Candidatus Dependentiae bacterium]
MDAKKILVANWKMNLRPSEEIKFIRRHHKELIRLAKNSKTRIVICPSFLSVLPISQIFSSSPSDFLVLGAQDCSTRAIGSFTGQISAACLAEAGCEYTIVGHSEERKAHKESDEQVAYKTIQLLIHGITPIICIGESAEEKKAGRSHEVLSRQIKTITESLSRLCLEHRYHICVAYEPLYAIGSGQVPSKEHLENVFEHVVQDLSGNESLKKVTYLYGGSVSHSQLPILDSIKKVDGYLVGAASLCFQELEKMLESWKEPQNSNVLYAEK